MFQLGEVYDEILGPHRSSFSDSRQLRGLKMGVPKCRQILPLQGELAEGQVDTGLGQKRKLGGQVKPGRHVKYPDNTPMSNMLLTVLDKAGVPTEKLGDSTGPIQPDYLTV